MLIHPKASLKTSCFSISFRNPASGRVKAKGESGIRSLPACCWHWSMPSARQRGHASPKDSACPPLLEPLFGGVVFLPHRPHLTLQTGTLCKFLENRDNFD